MVCTKRIVLSLALAIVAAAFVWAQRAKAPAVVYAQYEMRSVFQH